MDISKKTDYIIHNNIHERKNYAIWLCVLLFSLLIFMRDVSTISVPRVLFILLAALLFAFSPKSDIYCFLAFLAPLATGVSFTYIASIALVIVLVKQKKLSFDKFGIVCFLAIIFRELMSCLQGEFSLIEYFRFIGVLGVVIVFIFDAGNDYAYDKMLKFFLIGAITAIVCVWGQMMTEYSVNEILALKIRFGLTKSALDVVSEGMRISFNPNALGSLCVLASSIALLLHAKTKHAIYLIAVVFFAIQGVMTASRTFVITFLIAMLLFVLFSASSVKNFLRTIFIVLFCCIILYLLLGNFFSESLKNLLMRFDDADITNGRMDISKQYLDAWWDTYGNPIRFLFGSGLQKYSVKYGGLYAAHMSLVEILVTWGVSGIILYIALNARIIKKAKKINSNFSTILLIPYLCYIISSFAGQGFSSNTFIVNAMICYAAMNLKTNTNIERIRRR